MVGNMTLKERISNYTPTKYNPYYWWRRFKPRNLIHHYNPLERRIINGDFEPSDYHWWFLWEQELEKEALLTAKNPEHRHEIRSIFGERKRRLMIDFEKDETKIKSELYLAFYREFRVTTKQLEEKMLEFDGDLYEFYQHMKAVKEAK